jgi:hypothetical protein
MEMFQRNGELVPRGCDKLKGRGGNLWVEIYWISRNLWQPAFKIVPKDPQPLMFIPLHSILLHWATLPSPFAIFRSDLVSYH